MKRYIALAVLIHASGSLAATHTITGTVGSDTIYFGNWLDYDPTTQQWTNRGPHAVVNCALTSVSLASSDVVVVQGQEGNDFIWMANTDDGAISLAACGYPNFSQDSILPITSPSYFGFLHGNAGNDTVIGHSGPDDMYGGSGDESDRGTWG